MNTVIDIDKIEFEVEYDYTESEPAMCGDPGYDAEVILDSVTFHGCEFVDILGDSTLNEIRRKIVQMHENGEDEATSKHVDSLIDQYKEGLE